MNNNKTFFYFSIILLVLIPIILFCIIRKIKDKKFYKWYYENIPIDMFMSNNVNFFLQTGKYYSNFFDFRNVQNWGNDLNNGMQQLITNLKNTVLIKSNNPNCYKEVITSKGTIREIPIGRLIINSYYLGSDGREVPRCTRINCNGVIDDVSGGFIKPDFAEVVASYGFNLSGTSTHDIYSKYDTVEIKGTSITY